MALPFGQIDPNEPGFKTVFKVQSDQFNYSRNVPEYCEYCQKKRPPGSTPFPLCTGCREARFCSKKHQIEYWPKHKAFCRERQKVYKMMEEKDAEAKPYQKARGLPPLMERRRIVEDWVEVHRHSIEQALVSAIQTRSPRVDLYHEHVVFICSYRPESAGNPSTAFALHNVIIQRDPDRGSTPLSANFESFRATMVEPDKEMKRDDPGYIGAFLSVYRLDDEHTWMTCTYLDINSHDIPKFPATDAAMRKDWLYVLKYFVDKGLVFRCVGPTLQFWLPGLMEKKGNRWVWTRRSIEELKERDIRLTCSLRNTA